MENLGRHQGYLYWKYVKKGDQESGYLEVLQGIFLRILFDTKEDSLKVLCLYPY